MQAMLFNSEMWIAGASVVIACCALGVTIWQGRQNHKHNKLSVKPLLTTVETRHKINDTFETSVDIKNTGLGPAIIKDFILIYDDEEVSKNNRQLYHEFLNKIASHLNVKHYWFVPNSSMPADDVQELLFFEHKTDDDILFLQKLNIKINYQSIYGDETFTYDSRKDRLYHNAECAA